MTPEQRAAMSRGEVTGRVLAGDTSEPIASATVSLWSQRDSSLVTGTITGTDGTFAMTQLRPGRFYLKASFVGFSTVTKEDLTLSPQEWTVALGDIRLETDAEQLGEVVVEGEREAIEIGIDRTVYNVKDQPTLSGGNGTDVLEQLPSIELDIDGNISLRGSQNVAVLINGRPSQLTGEMLTSYLASLPASAIDRVEVIPNPSARYEPDGMSGILNIVLRQDAEIGLSGGLTLSASTQENLNASGNFGVGRGPLNLRVNAGVRRNTRPIIGTSSQENFDAILITNQGDVRDQIDDGERSGLSASGGFDLDYRLSEKNTLTFGGLASYRDSDNAGLYTTSVLLDDGAGVPTLFERFVRDEDDIGTDVSLDGRLGFQRIVEAATNELTAEIRLNTDWEDETETYAETDLDTGAMREVERYDQTEEQLNASAQIDYVRPLGGMKFETGAKSDFRRQDSRLDGKTEDFQAGPVDISTEFSAFVFEEVIHAAYAILSGERGKLSMQAGVRAEQALTTFDAEDPGDFLPADSFDNDYFNIFPSAFVQFKPTPTQSLKASYSKRVNRPRSRALNPVPSRGDELNVFVGNPELQPEFTHAFEVSYSRFSRATSITLTPFYRHTVDVITRLPAQVQPDGSTIRTFGNLSTSDSYGVEGIATYRMGRAFNAFLSANGYRVVTDGSNIESDFGNDGAWGWSLRGNASFTVREGTDIQLFGFYRAPMDLEQGRIGAFSMTTLGVRQKLLQDRASLSLRASDVFDTMEFNLFTENSRFRQDRTRRWGARDIQLTFTYNFGQQESRRDRERGEGGGGFDEMDMEG